MKIHLMMVLAAAALLSVWMAIPTAAATDAGVPESIPVITTTTVVTTTGATAAPGTATVTAAPATSSTSPMAVALIVATVLSVLTTALIGRIKKMIVPSSKRKTRLMALLVSGFVALIAGIVTAVGVGMPVESALVIAGGGPASIVVDAIMSLLGDDTTTPPAVPPTAAAPA